jgi:hypothetical protein
MLRAEDVAERLQARPVGAAREPVLKRRVGESGARGLALDPLMPVEPHLRRPRRVRAELDKRRPEVGVKDVEVIDPDPPLLAKEVIADWRGPRDGVDGSLISLWEGLSRRSRRSSVREASEDGPLNAIERIDERHP